MPEEPLLGARGRRAGAREILVVIAIAICQCAGAQLGHVLVHDASAAFLVWFSTGWNVFLLLPLLARSSQQQSADEAPCNRRELSLRLLHCAPFFVLWTAANILFVQALAGLPAAIVQALFSVTPTLVAPVALRLALIAPRTALHFPDVEGPLKVPLR